MSTTTTQSHYLPVREDWLARREEPILEPSLPIVDPHHHLWDRPDWRYMLPDLLADTNAGHSIVATVFVQCRAFHRAAGREELRPVGETEFVNGVAAMSASGQYGATRICAGIVGHADLRLGARVEAVLDAHERAGGGRFRGIRHITAHDDDPATLNPGYPMPAQLMADATFRAGLRVLARKGMTFDAWLYHPQIPEVTALARAVPEARIVLDHVGGPLGIGRYETHRADVFGAWQPAIRELAKCPNVCVKLGGLGMRINGFGFENSCRSAVVGDARQCLAAIHRDLHRGVRRRSLHVREQLPGRQGLVQLRGLLEHVQAPRRERFARREGGAVLRHRDALLQAGDLTWRTSPSTSPGASR